MRLHFIFPRWKKLLEDHLELKDVLSGFDVGNFRMAGLGVATAAGAVPEGNEITLTDENVSAIDYEREADLFCLSFFTPQATNAYRIADELRSRGKKVIGGGIHPTMVPEDAAPHFDSIMSGPAEGAWEEMLHDLKNGGLKSRYHGRHDVPFATPRRDLFRESAYLQAGVIQTARGCNAGCSFCVLPVHAGSSIELRPVDEVLEDIAALPFPCFFFADENLLFSDSGNTAYRRELFARMVEAKNRRRSFIATYPQFVKPLRDEDITLMAQAKVTQVYLVLGLKLPLKQELRDQRFLERVLRMKELGVEVLASFNLGRDGDDEPVEELIAGYCKKTETNLAEFIINTPFPGTETFAEYERAGRLLTREWEKYNAANVVFQPLHESPESLKARYIELWKHFYGDWAADNVYSRYARGFGGDLLRAAKGTSK